MREELLLDIAAAERSITQLERRLTDVATQFRASLGSTLDQVRTQKITVEADTTQATTALSGVTQEVDRAVESTLRLDRALSGLATIAAGFFAGRLLQVGVEYNTLVQRALAAFTTITGSLEDGRAVLDDITAFARSSPFPRQAFIEATQILLSFGFTAEQVVPTLGAVQDAVAAIGGTAQDIQEVVDVLATIQSTGRISAMELRRLGIRGINAAQLLAEEFGTTESAIRDGITRGTIDATDAIDALVAGMTRRFDGAAEGLKATWIGALDRIRGALRDIGSMLVAPFIDPSGGGVAIDLANQLADALRRLESAIGPLAEQMASTLGPALGDLGGTLIPTMIDAITALLPLITTFVQLGGQLVPVLTAVAGVLEALPDELLGLAGAFLAINSSIRLVNTALSLGGFAGISLFARNAGAAASAVDGATRANARFAGGLRGVVAGMNPVVATVAAGAGVFALWSNTMGDARAEGEAFGAQMRTSMEEPVESIDQLEARIRSLWRGINELQEVGGLRGLTIDRDYNESIRAGRDALRELVAEQEAARDQALAVADALGITGDRALELIRRWAELSDRPILEAQQPAIAALRAEQDELIAQYEEIQAALLAIDEAGIGSLQVDLAREALDQMTVRITEITREILALEAGAVRASDALAGINLTDDQLSRIEEMHRRFLDTETAILDLGATAPGVALRLMAVRGAGDTTGRAMLDLALAMNDADLSAAEFESAARALGVTVDELRGFVDGAVGALGSFVSTAMGALPSTSTVFAQARADAARFMSAGSGAGRAVQTATRQIDTYVKRLQDAQDELLKALSPPSERDLFRAETARERALFRQEEAAKAVAEAERLLARADRDAATERTSIAKLRERREMELRDARLRLIESTFGVEDAEAALQEVRERGTETDPKVIAARDRLAEVTQQLADAQERLNESQTRGGGGGGRSAAREAQVTAAALERSFRTQARVINDFRADLEALTEAGFGGLAATLAEEGPEVAGTVARELRTALEAGNRELVVGLDDARREFERAGNDALEFYRTILGPEMILEMGIIGRLSNEAFGENFDLTTQIEVMTRLAASGLDRNGQAIALIAASEGAEAARAWGALFNIDEEVIAAGIEASKALQNLPGDPYRTGGRANASEYMAGFSQGLNDGIKGMIQTVEQVARSVTGAMKRSLKIKSPSQVAADEIGRPFVEGIGEGIAAAARDLDARVVGLGRRMVSGASSTVQNIDQSRTINAPVQVVGASDPMTTAVRASNRLRVAAYSL